MKRSLVPLSILKIVDATILTQLDLNLIDDVDLRACLHVGQKKRIVPRSASLTRNWLATAAVKLLSRSNWIQLNSIHGRVTDVYAQVWSQKRLQLCGIQQWLVFFNLFCNDCKFPCLIKFILLRLDGLDFIRISSLFRLLLPQLCKLANLTNSAPENDFTNGQVDEGNYIYHEDHANKAHDSRAHAPLNLWIDPKTLGNEEIHGVLKADYA